MFFRYGIPWTACNIQYLLAMRFYGLLMTFGNSKLQPHDPTVPGEGVGGEDLYEITKTLTVKHIIDNIHSL